MPTLRVSRVVDAPADRVHRVLADYRSHHPRILPKPEFAALEVLEGGVGAGTRIRVTMRVMGTTTTMTMRVDEPQPGRILRERDEAGGVETTFTLVEEGARTRVEIHSVWPRGGTMRERIQGWLAPRIARSIYVRELAQLEDYVRSLG